MRRTLAALLLVAACGTRFGPHGGARTVVQLRAASDGHVVWEKERPAREGATVPVLAGHVVMVQAPGGGVTAYAVSDGHIAWAAGGSVAGATAGIVVVERSGSVSGLRVADGTVAWSKQTVGHALSSAEGMVLVESQVSGTAGPQSAVSMLDPATGRARWSTSLAEQADLAQAALTAGALVLATRNATEDFDAVYGLSPRNGRVLWKTPIREYVAAVETDGVGVALSVGIDDETARGVDPATGATTWTAPVSGYGVFGRPRLDRDGNTPNGFRRDLRTGTVLPGRVAFDLGLTSRGDLLCGAFDTRLTLVRGTTKVWESELPHGPRPLSYIDVSPSYVATVSAVGQEESHD